MERQSSHWTQPVQLHPPQPSTSSQYQTLPSYGVQSGNPFPQTGQFNGLNTQHPNYFLSPQAGYQMPGSHENLATAKFKNIAYDILIQTIAEGIALYTFAGFVLLLLVSSTYSFGKSYYYIGMAYLVVIFCQAIYIWVNTDSAEKYLKIILVEYIIFYLIWGEIYYMGTRYRATADSSNIRMAFDVLYTAILVSYFLPLVFCTFKMHKLKKETERLNKNQLQGMLPSTGPFQSVGFYPVQGIPVGL